MFSLLKSINIYGKVWSILRVSFHYGGRSARRDFWFFFTFYALMYFAAFGADVTYYREATPTGWLVTLQSLFGGREPFVWLHLLLLTPAMIAITVRRLHDRGYRGWWGLLYLIPLVGLIPMVAMLARAGQPGFNRFGADPLALATVRREDRQSRREAQNAQVQQTAQSNVPEPVSGQLAAAE